MAKLGRIDRRDVKHINYTGYQVAGKKSPSVLKLLDKVKSCFIESMLLEVEAPLIWFCHQKACKSKPLPFDEMVVVWYQSGVSRAVPTRITM